MDDKTRELLQKIIADKKRKSANQSGLQRGPGSLGRARDGQKKHKKGGGLFDK